MYVSIVLNRISLTSKSPSTNIYIVLVFLRQYLCKMNMNSNYSRRTRQATLQPPLLLQVHLHSIIPLPSILWCYVIYYLYLVFPRFFQQHVLWDLYIYVMILCIFFSVLSVFCEVPVLCIASSFMYCIYIACVLKLIVFFMQYRIVFI